MPIIGSLYPLVRGSGVSSQDLTSDEYQKLKDSTEDLTDRFEDCGVMEDIFNFFDFNDVNVEYKYDDD